MSLLSWFRPPRHLLLLFLAVTLVPATGLVWMGWRLFQQDRALAVQRIQERRERAADLIVTALQQCLTEAEQRLARPSVAEHITPYDDALLVIFKPGSIEARPKNRLPYYPVVPRRPEPPERLFSRGEEYEFRSQDYARAIAGFRELARSKDPAIRAGAHARIARNLRKSGQFHAALAAYEELAKLESITVGGVPADLVGRRARCSLLAGLERNDELQREAQGLYADLRAGRWQLNQAVYHVYAQEASGWLGSDREIEKEGLAFAGGVEWLWEKWSALSKGDNPASRRHSMELEGRPLTLVWKATAEQLAGLIVGPRYLEREWIAGLLPILKSQNVRVSLKGRDDRPIWGELPAPAALQTQRAASDTGLPWTLLILSANPQADLNEFASRRRLLLTGLAMVAILVSAGSYIVARAFLRELAAARLQSDFVAAVSHEFRTPLASLRQLTENLADGRVTTEERRRTYYQAQARATDRLHRLVEGLLDFGRMEAGVLRYRLEALDAAELAQSVVGEFQQEVAAGGYRIETCTDGAQHKVNADREALARALWNLLDNAVKYSPNCKTVQLEIKKEGELLAIAVRDGGLGIPADEQIKIFRKFFRGSAARTSGIKGTGIGLAMVNHILRAHGGEVGVESKPGVGSTFTLRLPLPVQVF
jgi:signal transduction histidine kinase